MEKGSDGPDLTFNLFLRFPDPVSFVNTPYSSFIGLFSGPLFVVRRSSYVLGFRFGSGPAFLYGKMAEAGDGSKFFD